jgi:AcrR family transcriptional regulator
MRQTGSIDPSVRDIVSASGLSNQAFYRHFASKDALLSAVLADGQEKLVASLARRMQRAVPGLPRVRAWIEGVLEQARRPDAAENTRPFAVNGARLADRFPAQSAASTEQLLEPLREEVRVAGGDERDATVIYELSMAMMNRALLARVLLTRGEVEHVVTFAARALESARGA